MSRLSLCLSLLLLVPSGALAHRASDSFLALSAAQDGTLHGHWDVALGDLSYALELAPDGEALSWGTLRAQQTRVARLLRQGLHVHGPRGACRLTSRELLLVELSDGTYARVPFELRCPDGRELRVRSSLLSELDRDHRVLLRVGSAERAVTRVLSASDPSCALPEAQGTSAWSEMSPAYDAPRPTTTATFLRPRWGSRGSTGATGPSASIGATSQSGQRVTTSSVRSQEGQWTGMTRCMAGLTR